MVIDLDVSGSFDPARGLRCLFCQPTSPSPRRPYYASTLPTRPSPMYRHSIRFPIMDRSSLATRPVIHLHTSVNSHVIAYCPRPRRSCDRTEFYHLELAVASPASVAPRKFPTSGTDARRRTVVGRGRQMRGGGVGGGKGDDPTSSRSRPTAPARVPTDRPRTRAPDRPASPPPPPDNASGAFPPRQFDDEGPHLGREFTHFRCPPPPFFPHLLPLRRPARR